LGFEIQAKDLSHLEQAAICSRRQVGMHRTDAGSFVNMVMGHRYVLIKYFFLNKGRSKVIS
jgi:hypothetical protein